jgi:hypothetical protein
MNKKLYSRRTNPFLVVTVKQTHREYQEVKEKKASNSSSATPAHPGQNPVCKPPNLIAQYRIKPKESCLFKVSSHIPAPREKVVKSIARPCKPRFRNMYREICGVCVESPARHQIHMAVAMGFVSGKKLVNRPWISLR